MEHLPIPEDCLPTISPFEYFEQIHRYDRLGFSGFLERVGTTPEDLRDQLIRTASSSYDGVGPSAEPSQDIRNLAGLIQEWCWFGLLHELELYTGVPMDTSKLVRRSGTPTSVRILTTEFLPSYLAAVQTDRSADAQSSSRASSAGRISACLRDLESLTSPLGMHTLPTELRETLIQVFLLTDAVIKVGHKMSKEEIYVPWRQSSVFEGSWCPSRRNYFQMLGSTSINFITDRLPSFDDKEHVQCSATLCVHNAALLSSGSSQHTGACEGNACGVFRADEQALVEILLRGGIPGLHFDRSEQMIIIEDVGQQRYIAFSHVWVHGLGNPAANALPQCQVRKLADLVDAISGPSMRFWIDTLSVPADSKHKPLAIPRLRQVYRGAERVMVLDKHLEQVDSDPLGQSLQLLGSDWLHRLWTLQEGKLAQKLCIRFRNETVELVDLVASLKAMRANDNRAIFINMDRIIGLLQGLFVEHKDITRRILWVAMSLCYRSVTVPTDEPICLATLLGLNLENYDSRPTMSHIYRAFANDLPEDLAFFNGKRLSELGLRWAPASLLHQPKIHIWSSGKAQLGDRGLLLTKDYLTFETVEDKDFEPAALDSVHFLTQPVVNDQQLAFTLISPPVVVLEMEKMALILHTPGNNDPPSSRAIFVEINQRDDTDTMFCRFVAVAQTARASRIEHAVRYLWKSSTPVRVSAQLQRSQRICID